MVSAHATAPPTSRPILLSVALRGVTAPPFTPAGGGVKACPRGALQVLLRETGVILVTRGAARLDADGTSWNGAGWLVVVTVYAWRHRV